MKKLKAILLALFIVLAINTSSFADRIRITPNNKAAIDANTIHRTSDGSDHTFIDQDVTSGSSPTLDGANITTELANDTTPQLGGDLDTNDKDILGSGGALALRVIEANGIIYNVLNAVQVESVTGATTAGTATLEKTGEDFLTSTAVGDTVIVYGGSTVADYGVYSIVSRTDTIITTNATFTGSDADVDFYVFRGGIIATGSNMHVNGTDLAAGSSKALTPVTDSAANFAANFTGANLYGGTFICNVTGTIQLPEMAAGMNFTIITLGDIEVIVDTHANDGYLMDGVTNAEGKNLTNLSTSGDIAVFQYYTADDWLITTNGWTPEA